MSTTPNSGYWWIGDLRIAVVGRTFQGDLDSLAWSDPLNGTTLTAKHDGDKKMRQSTQAGDFGQAKEIQYMPKPTELEVGVDAANIDLLAASILGTASAFTQGAVPSGSATKTLVLDRWVSLGVLNLSGVTITGKTEGTDFVVDPVLGLVKALTSGTAGQQTIAYTAGAVAGDKIQAGTETMIFLALMMKVVNNSDGLPGLLTIPKVAVMPSAAQQFIGAKDFQDTKFKGDIIKLPNLDLYTFIPNLVFS